MKNIKGIIGCVLVLCGFIGSIICAISAVVFTLQHPDMTEMRQFLEHPEPTVWCFVNIVVMYIGSWLLRRKK